MSTFDDFMIGEAVKKNQDLDEMRRRAEAAEAELARVKEAAQLAYDWLPDEYYGDDPEKEAQLKVVNSKLAAALRCDDDWHRERGPMADRTECPRCHQKG